MIERMIRVLAGAVLVLLIPGMEPEAGKYRYGGSRGGGGGDEQGYYVFVEVGMANPRNADSVLAVFEQVEDFGGGQNISTPIIPVWDDESSGRFGLGYASASGNTLEVSVWNFSADTRASGNGPSGGMLHFTVGPPIFTGGQYVGNSGSPGYLDMATEIEAQTADLTWGRRHALTETFSMKWSAGLRYAKFEETYNGFYDEDNVGGAGFGNVRYAAAKSNEGEMFGVRVGIQGRYNLGAKLSVSGGLGFSFLDGELTSSSSLLPSGTVNGPAQPSGFSGLVDDSRSGTIRDFELKATWSFSGGRCQVWGGWEQAEWEDIALDLGRNLPGTTASLRNREAVVFSGYKLGLYYRF